MKLPFLLLLTTLTAASADPKATSIPTTREDTIGPDYTPALEMTLAPHTPQGQVQQFIMKSTDSKIYPGIRGPYERKVWVYIPKQYHPGKAAPFIVVQDGGGYVKRMTPVLDNLIQDKKLPVMIGIFLDSGGGDGKGSERGLEYDAVAETYSNFIETEVLPKVSADYHVTLTKDPAGRATMGGSSGAACAFTMAWFHPERYSKVLSYSGTYVAQESPDNPASPHGAWEYHEHFIPQQPAKPIRIWMHVSENDNGSKQPESTHHNWVMANDRMAAALKAKNYDYRYVMAKNAGHVDGKVIAQTLPEALLWLWRDYKAAPEPLGLK